MKKSKLFLISLFLALIVLAYTLNLGQYLSLDVLKEHRLAMGLYYIEHTALFVFLYMLVYILIAGMGLPFAAFLTVAGGVFFGSYLGTVITLVSATLGATLSFMISRYMFRDFLEKKYAAVLGKFNAGVDESGINYVLTLRLIPLFPFFVVNTLLGLTRLPVPTYFFVSLVGMLPGTFLYTNAGKQLSGMDSLSDIASPNILLALVFLGCLSLLPVLYKKLKKREAL